MLHLPPRPPEHVPIVVDGPLGAAQLSWQLEPPQDALVVIVRGTFAIRAGQVVEPVSEPKPPMGDLHYGDDPSASLRYASDLCPFKPRADLSLVGHAYAQARARARGSTHVQLVFGKLRRVLAAIGDRRWQNGVPSKPQSFERIALRWENAFGGPSHPANPLGVGLDGAALPRLEDPEALIRNQRDQPPPACCAPVPRHFQVRGGKLGTYDAAWLDQRWPYFPKDVDWSYFNAAPAEQQMDYPRGNEAFDLGGVHPEHPVVSGRLPGLAPRVFAQMTAEADGAFREIAVRLDTVAFDADAMEVSLVWRGQLAVSAEHAPEVDRLFVMADQLNGRLSLEAAQERWLACVTALYGAHAIGGGTLDEKGEPAAAKPPTPPTPSPPPQAPVLSRDQALMLLGSGASLEGLSFVGCELEGVDFSGRKLAGAHFSDAALDGARFDEADLSGALFVRAKAARASFRGAELGAANLSEASLPEADFSEASLEGASLADADATRARFEGARLSLARLTDAKLTGATFDGATAERADFSGATLAEASFREATLDDAQLYDCAAERACFAKASLQRLRADGAHLERSSFESAAADEATFESAELAGASFARAELARAVFSRAQLGRATLSQAVAREARFRHAMLTGAQAAKADFMQANFEGADLSKADLRGANLYAVETWKAKLAGARLDGALVAASKLASSR